MSLFIFLQHKTFSRRNWIESCDNHKFRSLTMTNSYTQLVLQPVSQPIKEIKKGKKGMEALISTSLYVPQTKFKLGAGPSKLNELLSVKATHLNDVLTIYQGTVCVVLLVSFRQRKYLRLRKEEKVTHSRCVINILQRKYYELVILKM